MDEKNEKFCTLCGNKIPDGAIVCMVCGHGVNNQNETQPDFSASQEETDTKNKAALIRIARVFALVATLMNLITIIISSNDFALRYVCMLTAIIGFVFSLSSFIYSFFISKKHDTDTVLTRTSLIFKIVS